MGAFAVTVSGKNFLYQSPHAENRSSQDVVGLFPQSSFAGKAQGSIPTVAEPAETINEYQDAIMNEKCIIVAQRFNQSETIVTKHGSTSSPKP